MASERGRDDGCGDRVILRGAVEEGKQVGCPVEREPHSESRGLLVFQRLEQRARQTDGSQGS